VTLPQVPANSISLEYFGGPADVAFDARGGRAFVADGFRNRRVAVVDLANGRIERYWGGYGQPPSDTDTLGAFPGGGTRQFGTPVRCVALSADDLVYVCDPSRNRIQVFRSDGRFVREASILPGTRGGGSVWDIAFSRDRDQRFLFVADGMNKKVHVLERGSLNHVASFGDGGRQPGQFVTPHSVALDSRGNLYTVEAGEGKRVQRFVFKGVSSLSGDQGVVWPRRGGQQ
jgi:DNA-binding beta-propeller fold protein YncE